MKKRELENTKRPYRHYIAILYGSIASATKDPLLFNNACVRIMKNIDYLSYDFKKFTLVKIYQRLINSNIANIQKYKRR